MQVINVDNMYFNRDEEMCSIFHYTSPEALKSIVENSSIRFTNCAFLNDKEEYIYINNVIDEIVSEKEDPEVALFIEGMKTGLDKEFKGIIMKRVERVWLWPVFGDYYVLSGTSDTDSLPMWNYYVKSGDYVGYAIQLDVNELYKNINAISPSEGEFLYGRVIYDMSVQKNIIISFTRKLLNEFNSLNDDDRDEVTIEDYQDRFFDFVQRCRLFFKGEGFKHEKEVRVVVLADSKDIRKGFSTGFGIAKGLFKPYVEYQFPNGLLPIRQVILSPTIEAVIGEKGAEMLFDAHGYKNVKFGKSALNLRY